ncbi:MAG: hypothetical protein J0I20_32470 [Chloroflexi bacterium]|nr:hypothetical protein [Chloroflexota bacterium]OJV91986.1 MAG: hypothetical protein BGO39_12825 [Chloroflexi bacterium 54-19]
MRLSSLKFFFLGFSHKLAGQHFLKRKAVFPALALALLLSPLLATSVNVQAAKSTEITLTGTFLTVWGDPSPGDLTAPSTTYSLAADDGNVYPLSFDPRLADRLVNLYTKRVTVTGSFSAPSKTGLTTNPVLAVDKLDIAPGTGTSGNHLNSLGQKRFLSIMCQFSDIADTPRNLVFFQNQLGNTRPGFDNYIKEMSYGGANIDNSQAVGWVKLPSARSVYVNSSTDLNKLAKDCATASGRTDLGNFFGLNFMFNADLGCCAWGGSVFISGANGQSGIWRATWMPYFSNSRFGWLEHGVLAHEMAHSFGSLHSGSSIGYQYGSSWDVVSNPQANCTGAAIDATYGCLGQGIVSYNRDTMNFIPAGRKVTYSPDQGIQTYSLDFLSLTTPSSGSSKYMVVVPTIASPTTRYYTVEARRQEGYDSKLPLAQAVLIHDVDTTRGGGDPNAPIAYLYPPPGATHDATRGPGGDPGVGAAAANWPVGQTMTDTTNKITIRVVAATSTGFTIQVAPVAVPVTVTQTSDNSTGQANTLSWALNQANGDSSLNTLVFNLDAGATTINVTGTLPAVRSGLILKGKDCTDGSASPITINGAGNSSLNLSAGNIMLMGLVIKGFAGPQLKITNNVHQDPVRLQCTTLQKS